MRYEWSSEGMKGENKNKDDGKTIKRKANCKS
jgi:hypothetical protein